MATLKSKRLQQALQKAKNVGRAEESVIIDGCSIVLQSLPPSGYEATIKETSELEGAEHLYAYQLGHVCRAIVEIEGVDLRNVEYIEEGVPTDGYLVNAVVATETKARRAQEALAALGVELVIVPPDGGEERTVTIERHEWVRNQISTWSQEALAVAWRKYSDVVVAGEARAKEKVTFRARDEATEDKLRRLLLEAKELETALPPDLAKRVLEEAGYLQKTSAEEFAEVARRGKEFAEEQASKRAEPVEVEEPVAPPPPREDPHELMRTRTPMNQTAAQPVPPPQPVTASARPAFVPPQLRQSPEQTRAAQIAALEADVDPSFNSLHQNSVGMPPPKEVAELSKHNAGIDGAAVKGILDRPPVVGINPRFRKPTEQP